jgi:hypothetical protein
VANPVITAALKGVSFKSPYTGKTFQELTENILGRDGYLSGGLASDDGSFITIEPFRMVSRGIIGEALASSVVDVPLLSGPWYIVASLADDDPDSGVVIQSTSSLEVASSGVVIATKTGDVWRNPSSVDVRGAASKAAEPGKEDGFSSTYQNAGDAYDGTDGTTVVEKIRSNKGLLVTGDGQRIVSEGVDGESARQFEETPPPASTLGNRTDKIVMRELEPFTRAPEYLVGGTRSGTTGRVALGAGTWQPHYYGERKGSKDEQWLVWANGSDIHIYGGTGGGGPTDFGDVTHALAGGTKVYPRIAGRRDSDGALIVLYVDTGNLFMVSFSATTGAIVDAPLSIEVLPNAVDSISAVIDQNDDARIVFQYSDVTRQTFIMRTSVAVATFGVSTMTPDYVQRSGATGNEELRPEIRVCRNGISHICYLSGSSSIYGTSIVYVKLDSNNTLISAESSLVASAVGVAGVQEEDGLTPPIPPTDYDRLYSASMTLTPHDEVYVALEAKDSTETFRTALLLFSPELTIRTGYAMVVVEDNSAYRMRDVGMTHADDGGLIASFRHYGASNEQGIYVYHLDSQPGKNGTLANLIKNIDEVAGLPTTLTTDPFLVTEMGPAGELAHVWRIGTTVERLHTPGWEGELLDAHPKDIPLHAVELALHASETVEEQGVTLLDVRPKKLNHPIVVGENGDYQGYGSLQKAVNVASRAGGGQVVLRSGSHEGGTLNLPANVSLIGETGASILGDVRLEGYRKLAFTGIFGNIIEDVDPFDPAIVKAGSWVNLYGAGGTGFHRVVKILRPRSDGGGRALLSDGLDGITPAGTDVDFLATGGRIENVSIEGNLILVRCYQSIFKNISLIASTSVLSTTANYYCEFENFNLLEGTTANVVSVNGGDRNTYKDFRFSDIRGVFNIGVTEQNPTLIGCSGDDSNPASEVYNVATPRTTPLSMIACEGLVDPNTDANALFIVTNVGKVIRQPEGLGGISFEDDNIFGGSGTALRIPLSSSVLNGDKLPAGNGSDAEVGSILEALHIPEGLHDVGTGDQFIAGGITSLGAFPQMDIAAASYVLQGRRIATGALSNSDGGTVLSTRYYWYLKLDGTFERNTSGTLGGRVMVATAVTNGANNTYENLVDMRNFSSQLGGRRSLNVGNSGLADFLTLQGALHWLELNKQPIDEIVVIGQLDMTNGESPIEINFQQSFPLNGIQSLVIRGLGEDAGIKWGQDSDLFRITGLAAENAATADGQKASIRFHNLLFDNTNGVGPSNTALFRFDNSYFTEVSIDHCRSQSNAVFGWNRAVSIGCHIDVLTIAENTFEVRGLGASNGAIVVNDGTGRIVKNGYVFRNTVRADLDGSTADTRGIVIGATNEKIWVAENSIDNGRVDNQAFAKGIEIQPFNPTAKVPAGARWVVDNVLGNTQINNVTLCWGIDVETNFGVGSPVYIIGNTIYDSWAFGVTSFFAEADVKIIDNDINARLGGIDVYGTAVIANNRINVTAGTSTYGIEALEGNTVISGNLITGVAQDGILISDGGSISGSLAVVGNTINGTFALGGIRSRRFDSLIASNSVDNDHGSGTGIYLNGFSRNVVTGNYVKAVNRAFRISGGDDNVVTGNRFEATQGQGALLLGSRQVFTGNHVSCRWEFNSAAAVGDISCDESAITGNYFGARINADYGNGGAGQVALTVAGRNNAFSGNVAENRGVHSSKSTVIFESPGDLNAFVGNTIRNIGGGAVFSSNIGATNEFGESGGGGASVANVLPGANRQTAG